MAPQTDMAAANATYNGFVKGVVWGTGISIALVALVITLIT